MQIEKATALAISSMRFPLPPSAFLSLPPPHLRHANPSAGPCRWKRQHNQCQRVPMRIVGRSFVPCHHGAQYINGKPQYPPAPQGSARVSSADTAQASRSCNCSPRRRRSGKTSPAPVTGSPSPHPAQEILLHRAAERRLPMTTPPRPAHPQEQRRSFASNGLKCVQLSLTCPL